MCGITGIVQFDAVLTNDGTIEKMTEMIAHRGPDATDTKKYEHAHLGHQRLAIIDVTYGHQPMTRTVNGEDYTIVYNGELYNAPSLRQELQSLGYQFTTTCDTEVLLVCYIHYGPQHCLQKLNGIFSFAVWEANTERLFLARDRLGVKPLFYVQQSNRILFASEMKALLVHPTVEPVVTKRGLQQLLTIGPSRMLGETVYYQIQELKPAHAMLYEKNNSHKWCYWTLQSAPHEQTTKETIEQTRDLLEQTVKQQLQSDVPLCTLLSGGIDSSILTALAAIEYEKEGRKLTTFSVDYEEQKKYFTQNDFQITPDAPFIEAMTERYGTGHKNVVLTPEQLAETLQEALSLKDYPGMTDVDSSLFLFCKEIAQDFKVALSGECADELFGGYPWYFGQFDGFPWVRNIKDRQQLLKPTWRETLQLEEMERVFFDEALQGIPHENEQHRFMQLNFNYFMQTLLERKDRMSMGSGLEVRVPFANHELVEYVWNIPWDMKTLDGQAKGLLRHATKDLLPESIVTRKKNPYPKVQHPRYTDVVAQMLEEVLTKRDSVLHELFDEEQLQILLKDDTAFQVPWFGQLMSRPQLMAYLWQIDQWVRQYNVQLML